MNDRMDQALRGHPYAKSPLDMACWDILGKVTGQPVATLLGGRYGESFPLYRAISQDSPEAMAERVAAYRAEGYTKFQLKVGGDPNTDIRRIRKVAASLAEGDVLVADANTRLDAALRPCASRAPCAMSDVYIEQPCIPLRRMLEAVRCHTDLPFILDEVVDSVGMVVHAACDQAMDVINLKISKVGGLTKARQIRDLCVSLGIALTIEDTWGGDITTKPPSLISPHSTPPAYLFSSTDFEQRTSTVSDCRRYAPARSNGHLAASLCSGLLGHRASQWTFSASRSSRLL